MNRRHVDFVARLNDTMQEAVLTGLQERLKVSPLIKRGMARQFEMLQKAAAREGTPERAERLKRYCARLAAILAECGAGAEQEKREVGGTGSGAGFDTYLMRTPRKKPA